MFISIVDLDWWSWNSSQVSSGPFKELLGNSWYLSLRSTLGKERERKWGKERKKKRGRRRKKLPWALLTFLLLFAGCYLIHNPLLPTTVGPPNPRFCLLGFNQLLKGAAFIQLKPIVARQEYGSWVSKSYFKRAGSPGFLMNSFDL